MITLEGQELLILEWLGFYDYSTEQSLSGDLIITARLKEGIKHIFDWEPWTDGRYSLPKLTQDLNAIHEVEKILLQEHQAKIDKGLFPIDDGTGKYMAELGIIVAREHVQGSNKWHGTFHCIYATASQRLEALCKTLFPDIMK